MVLERTCFAVNLSPLSYLNIPSTSPLNSSLTPPNASSALSKTFHIPKGLVRNIEASGQVSGVGVPRVRKMLRMRPSWLPSSWVGGEVKIGVGVGEVEARYERRTPRDQMSMGVE